MTCRFQVTVSKSRAAGYIWCMKALLSDIRACALCADRFAATETRHAPRPVLQVSTGARILIAGQAPGARVHESGRPFTDPSGDRLRDWMGVDEPTFYDAEKVAIVPMAFCFPGYNAKGSDLPPPRLCADTWRAEVMARWDLTLRQLPFRRAYDRRNCSLAVPGPGASLFCTVQACFFV